MLGVAETLEVLFLGCKYENFLFDSIHKILSRLKSAESLSPCFAFVRRS